MTAILKPDTHLYRFALPASTCLSTTFSPSMLEHFKKAAVGSTPYTAFVNEAKKCVVAFLKANDEATDIHMDMVDLALHGVSVGMVFACRQGTAERFRQSLEKTFSSIPLSNEARQRGDSWANLHLDSIDPDLGPNPW